jgi:hypothetical protein
LFRTYLNNIYSSSTNGCVSAIAAGTIFTKRQDSGIKRIGHPDGDLLE